MDTLFRWGKMHCMQKALFVLLSVVLVACSGEEKVNPQIRNRPHKMTQRSKR